MKNHIQKIELVDLNSSFCYLKVIISLETGFRKVKGQPHGCFMSTKLCLHSGLVTKMHCVSLRPDKHVQCISFLKRFASGKFETFIVYIHVC